LGAASELASAGGALVEPVNQSWTNVFRDSPFPQTAARPGEPNEPVLQAISRAYDAIGC
jgi:hypothetical protein